MLARIRLRVAEAIGYLAARVDRRVDCIVIRAGSDISQDECAACLQKGLEHAAKLMIAVAQTNRGDRAMDLFLHLRRPGVRAEDR